MFDLGNILLIFLLDYRFFKELTGPLAALLFPLSPLSIQYVQEVRMDAMDAVLNRNIYAVTVREILVKTYIIL